jgi:hypothetical protein
MVMVSVPLLRGRHSTAGPLMIPGPKVFVDMKSDISYQIDVQVVNLPNEFQYVELVDGEF